MTIRHADPAGPSLPADRSRLFDIWARSVRQTHDFISDGERAKLPPLVGDDLASPDTEFWGICCEQTVMGLAGNKIESLFLASVYLRQGGGSRLVAHARTLHDELTVDVNEPAAVSFYKPVGFVVEGRSEQDDQGTHTR